MKKPENFSSGATIKTTTLEEAINNNFTSEEKVSSSTTVTTEQKKKDDKEKFLVSMSKGERSIYKAFCALNNVSMNHFVMCAMDYFKEDLESGKVTITPHSYKRVNN